MMQVKKRFGRRVTSFILALVMLVGFIPAFQITTEAATVSDSTGGLFEMTLVPLYEKGQTRKGTRMTTSFTATVYYKPNSDEISWERSCTGVLVEVRNYKSGSVSVADKSKKVYFEYAKNEPDNIAPQKNSLAGYGEGSHVYAGNGALNAVIVFDDIENVDSSAVYYLVAETESGERITLSVDMKHQGEHLSAIEVPRELLENKVPDKIADRVNRLLQAAKRNAGFSGEYY